MCHSSLLKSPQAFGSFGSVSYHYDTKGGTMSARKVARHPDQTVGINLRIRESLRRKIERAAEQRRLSLNSEIKFRLEDSFERKDIARSLSDLIDDLQINWARYGH